MWLETTRARERWSRSPRKLTFGCACGKEECSYIVRSSLEWDGGMKAFTQWTVKEMGPHTCSAVVVQKGQKNSNYSPEQLVPAFVGIITDKTSVGLSFLKGIVKQYTFRDPDLMFVSRLRNECILEKWGKEEVLTDELEAFLEGLEEHGHKVTIKTATKKEFEVIGMHNKKGAPSPPQILPPDSSALLEAIRMHNKSCAMPTPPFAHAFALCEQHDVLPSTDPSPFISVDLQ